MAFTGVATVTSLRKYKARITGLSLAGAATGTIGLNGDATAGVQLPAAFPAAVDAAGAAAGLAMADLVKVEVKPVGVVVNPWKVHVTKGGAPFQVAIVNDDGVNATPAFDVELTFQHSAYR